MKPDFHGDRYNCEREELSGGHISDDGLANEVYMNPSLPNLTYAKDRIRWLSRKLKSMEDPTTTKEESWDEPVYQYLSYALDKWVECTKDQVPTLQKNGFDVRTLIYIKENNDGLRKAAEELVKEYFKNGWHRSYAVTVKMHKLQAELDKKS